MKRARRTKNISSSAIREIFKALRNPNIISLAGGSPAPEYFPLESWEQMISVCHQKYGKQLYQYGITEGFEPLRQIIADDYSRKNAISVASDQIVITSGAQSAIELSAKVLLDPHDTVLLEAPTFLASIKTFHLFEAKMISMPLKEDGVDIVALEKLLEIHPQAKCIYLIPNFQNPMGATMSLEKRRAIVGLLQKRDIYLIEDDPYRDLRYQGDHLPSIHSLIPEKVIYIGSLSKTFSPGMRIGYCIAPPELHSYIVAAKQATDVHTNTLAQALAAEFMTSDAYETYQSKMKKEYTLRLNTLLNALSVHCPKQFSWTHPEGGMFVWVTGPTTFNATQMYEHAIEKEVAYVPGTFFFADENTNHNTFRLSFTGSQPKDIERGIKILAELCKAHL
jgi:2-aminoadipate transaminase